MTNFNLEQPPRARDYRRAVRQAYAKINFRRHIVAYFLGSSLLVLIYLATQRFVGFTSYPWFIWVVIAWGVLLLIHFLLVFVFSDNRAWDRRRQMIEDEIRRLENSRQL